MTRTAHRPIGFEPYLWIRSTLVLVCQKSSQKKVTVVYLDGRRVISSAPGPIQKVT